MTEPKVYTFEEWIKESNIKDKCRFCGKKLTSQLCDNMYTSHREKLYILYNKQKEEDLEKWNKYYNKNK